MSEAIKANISKENEYTEEWKLLEYHTFFITRLSEIMQLREQRKDDEAMAKYEELTEMVRKDEIYLRNVYDACSTHNGCRSMFFKRKKFA